MTDDSTTRTGASDVQRNSSRRIVGLHKAFYGK